MSMAYGTSGYRTGAKPYVVTTPNPNLVISVADFKLWAKVFNDLEDAIIEQIIQGVTLQAEKYTHRVFLTTEFETKRDVFGDVDESPNPYYVGLNNAPIVPRRSPFHDLVSIEYVDTGGATQTLSGTQLAFKESYSEIYPAGGDCWPGVDCDTVHPITIKFNAGYGDTGADIPEDLLNALLAHMTSVYKNRGDCSNMSARCSCKFAPAESMAVYDQYRILEFRAF